MRIPRLLLALPFLFSSLSQAQVPGWTPTSKPPQGVGARAGHDGIWTGKEVIIWGGSFGTNGLTSGARFDLKTNTWRPMTLLNAARPYLGNNSAVWAGEPVNRMIIFGGSFPPLGLDGGIYNPEADVWTKLEIDGDRAKGIPAPPNVPTFRLNHSAVWTGKEMIVWGGHCTGTCYRKDGAAYDPQTDKWRKIQTPSFLAGRKEATAIWTGTHMLIWGGDVGGRPFNDGGLYDPENDTWKPITLTAAPVARIWYSAVWTGTEMIIWGGAPSRADGKIYNPVTDRWRPMSTYGLSLNSRKQALGKEVHSAVWTGEEMIVWGGRGSTPFNGYRYSPKFDQWLPITNENAPTNRILHTAVWGDGAMMIWGGLGKRVTTADGPYAGATGGVYRPACSLYVMSPKAGDRVDREVTFELGTGTLTGAPQRAQLVVDGVAHGDWTPVPSDGRVKLSLSDELTGNYKLRVKTADANNSECLSEEIPVIVGPTIKVQMVVYDSKPSFLNGKSLREEFGGGDPKKMTEEYLAALKAYSGGFAEYKLLEPIIEPETLFKNVNGHVISDDEFYNRASNNTWGNLAWNKSGQSSLEELPLGDSPVTSRYVQSFKTWGQGVAAARIVIRKVGNPQLPLKISLRTSLDGAGLCPAEKWCGKTISPADVSAVSSTLELGQENIELENDRLYYFVVESQDPFVLPDPNNHYMISVLRTPGPTPGHPLHTDPESELVQGATTQPDLDLNLMLLFYDRLDYKYLLQEKTWNGRPRSIVEDVRAGAVDEVVAWGPHFSGLAEAAMVGRGAFNLNGAVWGDIASERAFAVMGFNYNRAVTDMLHNYGHRTEGTMTHVYGAWKNNPYWKLYPQPLATATNWDKFSTFSGSLSPGDAIACGAVHFPPNVHTVPQSLAPEEYTYDITTRRVDSTCEDWKNYPNLTGRTTPITARAWKKTEMGFLKWWFERLPKVRGRNNNQSDGKLNNWWRYIVEPWYYTDASNTRQLERRSVP